MLQPRRALYPEQYADNTEGLYPFPDLGKAHSTGRGEDQSTLLTLSADMCSLSL